MNFDEVIQQARAGFEPTHLDRERVRTRLLARVAGTGAAVALMTKGSAGAAATALGGQSLASLTKLLFTSMALTFAGAGAVVAVSRSLSTPSHETVQAGPAAAPRTVAPNDSSPRVGVTGTSRVPTPEAVPSQAAKRDVSTAAPPSGPSPTPPSSSSLDAELALLKQARLAVTAGQPEQARRLLRALDEQHPQGSLLEERSALRVLAACDAHEVDAADKAGEFLRRFPKSVYAPKLERSCGLAAPPPSGTRPPTASFTDQEGAGH